MNFCRPLIQAGRWFSGFILIFVVSSGFYAYGNILLGCMVDKSLEISSESTDRARATAEIHEEQVRKKFLHEFATHLGDGFGETEFGFEHLVTWISTSPSLRADIDKLGINEVDIQFIFRVMDPNNCGLLSFRDLSAALTRFHGEAKGQDLIHIQTLLTRVRTQVEVTLEMMSRDIVNSLDSSHGNLLRVKELRRGYENSIRVHTALRLQDKDRGYGRREAIRAVHAELLKSNPYYFEVFIYCKKELKYITN